MSGKRLLIVVSATLAIMVVGCGKAEDAGFQEPPKSAATTTGGPNVGPAEGAGAPAGGSDTPVFRK